MFSEVHINSFTKQNQASTSRSFSVAVLFGAGGISYSIGTWIPSEFISAAMYPDRIPKHVTRIWKVLQNIKFLINILIVLWKYGVLNI